MSQPRLVEMRFILNREKQVPEGLRQIEPETVAEKDARDARQQGGGVSGEEVIESTDKVSLFDFMHELLDNDYVMVDGYWRYQIMSNWQQKPVVRFTFVHYDHLEEDFLNDELPREVATAQMALFALCKESMWRSQVWKNPYFQNQEPVKDESALSVNLIGRQPLFDQNGNIHGVWARDEAGEVIRDEDGNPKEKIYTTPNFSLRFRGGQISLDKVDEQQYLEFVTKIQWAFEPTN